MARINLSFNDRNYTIEYNRASIKEFLKVKDKLDDLDQVIALIKCGLIMHHEDDVDMPDENEIFSWVMAMGDDVKNFAEALREMVEEALNAIKADRKNLKWEKVA